MKYLRELSKNDIAGKRFLVRLDLNVPVRDGVVVDDFRIKSSLPTLEYIYKNGGYIVVLSHCESNVGESCTLDPAIFELNKYLPKESFTVLPNLRENSGEKDNDENYARELSKLGDYYVNDAFSVSHRAHASIVGVPKFLPSFAGFQLEKEIKELSKAFNAPKPFVFVLGGAKFDTKLPLIQKFLDKADKVFIGGALANDLLKSTGFDVKDSVVSKTDVDLKSVAENPKVIKVEDVVWEGDKIFDIGEKTILNLVNEIKNAKFVLWNGPLGFTEKGFNKATYDIAHAIVNSGAESIIGGGDTIGAIAPLGITDKFTFVSTGGGATLDFLANETLVGIEALK